ncbi:hypothetical protein GFS24_07125 [Chitinophaga sp. SYP-B3965]|uniref:hypothetical protein n=1 Tax=Chitinophaga sp. SYP-B3965 TaxID=2663120 RepID=UPI001299CFD1|nr:hypothetical protein [Chitinophaga sp. SYP-B3965]MRG44878.1 hypothetical protein [Chitinophaga sp. SYP-B3965]
MSWLRFLLKFSFICNCCYLIGFIIRMVEYTDSYQHVVKHIMVLGGLVAAPLNIIVCLLTTILLLVRKVQWTNIHPYIFVLNVIILLIQLELFI